MFDRQGNELLAEILRQLKENYREQVDTNVKLQAIFDEQLIQTVVLNKILAVLAAQPVATKLVFQLGNPVQQ